MFKQIFPGLTLLIGMCIASAVLQTLDIIEPDSLIAGQLSRGVCKCDCDPCGPLMRPTR